jgi:hypothetical protein
LALPSPLNISFVIAVGQCLWIVQESDTKFSCPATEVNVFPPVGLELFIQRTDFLQQIFPHGKVARIAEYGWEKAPIVGTAIKIVAIKAEADERGSREPG